jgi:hypothetical protein
LRHAIPRAELRQNLALMLQAISEHAGWRQKVAAGQNLAAKSAIGAMHSFRQRS